MPRVASTAERRSRRWRGLRPVSRREGGPDERTRNQGDRRGARFRAHARAGPPESDTRMNVAHYPRVLTCRRRASGSRRASARACTTCCTCSARCTCWAGCTGSAGCSRTSHRYTPKGPARNQKSRARREDDASMPPEFGTRPERFGHSVHSCRAYGLYVLDCQDARSYSEGTPPRSDSSTAPGGRRGFRPERSAPLGCREGRGGRPAGAIR